MLIWIDMERETTLNFRWCGTDNPEVDWDFSSSEGSQLKTQTWQPYCQLHLEQRLWWNALSSPALTRLVRAEARSFSLEAPDVRSSLTSNAWQVKHAWLKPLRWATEPRWEGPQAAEGEQPSPVAVAAEENKPTGARGTTPRRNRHSIRRKLKQPKCLAMQVITGRWTHRRGS